ncbi:MAG: family 16 glycoside hydrolase [Planctomycetota bacterium]
MDRPRPPVVTAASQPGGPPSDAIVLFDGKDLSQWVRTNGEPPKWKVENGYMEAVKKAGSIKTTRGFGDCQLHIEWARAGQRQQRRLPDGQVRGAGARLVRQYHIRGRPGRGGLRPEPAHGQCVPRPRKVAEL